jgi:hypothetical protein
LLVGSVVLVPRLGPASIALALDAVPPRAGRPAGDPTTDLNLLI